MTPDIDHSPEWHRQARVERATLPPLDPEEADYFRLYRALEAPLPVSPPADLADRVLRRRSRALFGSRLLWTVLVLLSVGVGVYGVALTLSSLSQSAGTAMDSIPAVEWPLLMVAVLAVVAGVGWVGRRQRFR